MAGLGQVVVLYGGRIQVMLMYCIMGLEYDEPGLYRFAEKQQLITALVSRGVLEVRLCPSHRYSVSIMSTSWLQTAVVW